MQLVFIIKFHDSRTALEKIGYYDASRKIICLDDQETLLPPLRSSENFALPITDVCRCSFASLQQKQAPLPHPFEECVISDIPLPPSKLSHVNLKILLKTSILKLLHKELVREGTIDELMKSIPTSWECHGDLVVLSPGSFSGHCWTTYFDSLSNTQALEFWLIVSSSLKCRRLALGRTVSSDGYRSSKVTLVLGEDGWVDHVDNGIHYVFDVTKCMFSSGNITEKLRLASFDCRGETVVDLYAGIGYFVLPYLVHAGAHIVHACEWNSNAVEALQKGLKANGVGDKCIIHFGDSRKVMKLVIVYPIWSYQILCLYIE